MSCQSARQLIQDSLDGMLPLSADAELRRHLEGCEGCRRDHASLSQAVSALEALPRIAAPPELLARMTPELDRMDRSRTAAWRRWAPGGAIAAGLLLALGLTQFQPADPGSQGPMTLGSLPQEAVVEAPTSAEILQWVDASADPMDFLPF